MQIVRYETRPAGEEDAAALVLAEGGDLQCVSLAPGTDLAYTLTERRCAGRVRDGRHEPCRSATAPYCDVHTSRWPCARCRGDCNLPVEACEEEHAVYLAAFPPATFKVGVTRSWRLETRLREQGAVRAAHLRTVVDGRVARTIEADIAEELQDTVRVETKIDGLHREVDDTAWEALLAEFEPIETYAFDYGLDLTDRPIAERLATGTVRGTIGRVLVLSTGGGTVAVDMRDLLGYEVEATPSSVDVQSNLGSFG